MEQDVYKAPESEVDIEESTPLVYAGFWIRVGASLVDTVLIILLMTPISMAVALFSMSGGGDFTENIVSTMGVMDVVSKLGIALVTILFWVYKSATPGKMLFGLRIVHLGASEKLSFGRALVRYLGYLLSIIVLFIGLIWVAFDKRKQGWHDKMANTVVVKK